MNAESAIADAAERVSNWGFWGPDDVLGTLNFIEAEKRARAAALVRRGAVFSLACAFDADGPQRGWRNRVNPVHTMLSTGDDAVAGRSPFPHGIGGADDTVFMPLQCSTHWDGLGHIFDHGMAWNGRRANDDGFAITEEQLDATIAAQGPSASVGRGDVLLLRTGQLSRCRRDGWGTFAGGDAPGLSFTTIDWLHRKEVAGITSDTWGVEVRPNEFPDAFQPWHQVVIPHLGLMVGEMFDLEALAEDCVSDGVYEFLLVAAPLPVTGAVGAPVVPIAVK